VIVVRLAWVMTYNGAVRLKNRLFGCAPGPAWRRRPRSGGLLVAWCGMRGMVTLAAALALPEGFPYRDFILLAAFAVVLGTLVIQGLTLKPLLGCCACPTTTSGAQGAEAGPAKALKAALAELDLGAIAGWVGAT
jgi:NhaP-type Na+/H+ or K+/H+ antiporter